MKYDLHCVGTMRNGKYEGARIVIDKVVEAETSEQASLYIKDEFAKENVDIHRVVVMNSYE